MRIAKAGATDGFAGVKMAAGNGCYKAAACLCKCNLDEGGCGSSKEALRECYEENEKLARDLSPDEKR